MAQQVLKHACMLSQSPSDPIEERALIFNARPSDPLLYTMRLQLDQYLGVLPAQGHHPARTLLSTHDPAQFRGALAECMTAWFLIEKLRLRVVAIAPGKRPAPDLIAYFDHEPIFVEVKSLLVPTHASTQHVTDRIVQRIDDALPQLSGVSVVVLALRLPRSLWEERRTITSAVTVALKPQVSAVLALEERIEVNSSGFFHIDHHALVLHNSRATFPAPQGIFGNLPQVAVVGGQVRGSTGPSKGGDCILPKVATRRPRASHRISTGAP
jgi:hypothetical protein